HRHPQSNHPNQFHRQPQRMIKQSALLALLALSTAATARAQSPLPLAWEEAAPGIWRATVGTPESIGLLKAAGAEPRVDALARMPAAPFPLPRAGIQASSVDGAVVLRLPLGP